MTQSLQDPEAPQARLLGPPTPVPGWDQRSPGSLRLESLDPVKRADIERAKTRFVGRSPPWGSRTSASLKLSSVYGTKQVASSTL